MRKIIFTLTCLSVVLISMAQNGINYQAVVRNASGEILQNQNISVVFSIISGSTAGPTVYAETHALTTNNFGNVVAIIGQGTPTSGTFNAINWGSADHFLNVEIDGTDMGTTQFMSVPYAQYTEKANQATMISETDFDVNAGGNGKIAIGGSTSGNKLTVASGMVNSPNQLIDFKVDTLNSANDILNLYTGSASADDAQFIEANKGAITNFRVDVDGSVSRNTSGLGNDLLPIAYGYVNASGTLIKGSSNIGTITNPTTGEYLISITGETINTSNIIVFGNTIGNSRHIVSFENSLPLGNLRVFIRDVSVNPSVYDNGGFSFIVYKP